MKHLTCALLASAPLWALPDSAASLLKRHAGFTEGQISAVRRGERVVRMIDTGDNGEVAFAAVSRLPVSYASYMQRVRSGTLYKARDPILQVGKFSGTVKSLGPDGVPIPDAVAAYKQNGVISFGSSREPVDTAKEFVPLVQKMRYLRERLPAAYEYLQHASGKPGTEYFLWKQLTFGLRPVTRVAHVSVWEDRPGEAFMLMKQIYANRYFHSSFQVDHIIADGDSVYLITLNYGRSSWLQGISGKMIRPIVVSRTHAMAEKTLDQARRDFMEERQAL